MDSAFERVFTNSNSTSSSSCPFAVVSSGSEAYFSPTFSSFSVASSVISSIPFFPTSKSSISASSHDICSWFTKTSEFFSFKDWSSSSSSTVSGLSLSSGQSSSDASASSTSA